MATILCVSGNQMICKMLQKLMKKEQHIFFHADQVEKLNPVLHLYEPDLILFQAKLGNHHDFFETIKKLHLKSKLLTFSFKGTKEYYELLHQYNHHVLSIPFSEKELIYKINELIKE